MSKLKLKLDAILNGAVSDDETLPCAAAVIFDRNGVVFQGASGTRSDISNEPMTPDSVVWVASLTKSVTGTAAMQLVEQGQMDLDAPAGDIVPELAEVQVLDGFDADGTPKLRPPASAPTLRQLLTHTAGFGYDFWHPDLLRYVEMTGVPALGSRQRAALNMPLVFDPGTDWLYGINIDWVGVMVEAASGVSLGEWMKAQIFDPLGMNSTGFDLTDDMRGRLVKQRHRTDQGLVEPEPPAEQVAPEIELGGGGLFSTVADYARFLRMILNGGELDGARVLQAETVADMGRNHMGDLRVQKLMSMNQAVSRDAEFFPGLPKTWGLSFMINEIEAPTGRSAGSLAWAGLANSYYWIDPTKGLGGVFTSQLLPFADPAALSVYMELEKAVYDTI